MRRSVMSRMHCPTVWLGATVVTGADMICHTGVSAELRPISTTLRA